jgi:hypothetical protein
VFTSNPDDLNKRKTVIVRRFLFLAFIYMAAADINIFLPAVLSSPERLGEVRRRAIFPTPSSSF